MKKYGILLMALLGSVSAWAHPGHGHFAGNTLAHYLTSTQHLVPIAVGIVLVAAMGYQFAKSRNKS